MIEIDGSYGEGGGQILRTSLMLSAITKKPFRIFNIRKKRKKPGLMHSHLNTLNAIAEITNAKVIGNYLNSTEVEFYPNEVENKFLKINIGTAGSITLLLQALIPVVKKIRVIGGTDVPFSPTTDYFSHVFLSILNKFGIKTKLKIIKRGFYPKGGGEVEFEVLNFDLERIEITERGEKLNTEVYVVSNEEKDAEKLSKLLNGTPHFEYNKYGKAFHAHTHFENTIIGADDLNSLYSCAKKLKEEINNDGTLDRWMGDMIIPYIGLANGKFKANKITNHLKTNIWVCEKFLNVKFGIDGRWIYLKK